MTKTKLFSAVEAAKIETKDALQIVYDALNNGQQTKLLRNKTVKALFDLYGVVTG